MVQRITNEAEAGTMKQVYKQSLELSFTYFLPIEFLQNRFTLVRYKGPVLFRSGSKSLFCIRRFYNNVLFNI